ncbi:MAG: radical SAM protein [Muribaculaceae bacterium]|nr:radical SAM protein [Muribaculaceae bacterium]
MDTTIWILNPDYVFKNDTDRVCMFSKRNRSFDSTPDWIGYIHPHQAMILGMFCEPHPIRKVITMLSNHFSIPYEKMYSLIKDFMGNKTPVYTKWHGLQIGFPKNVLIQVNPEIKNVKYDFCTADLKCTTVDLTQDRNHKAPHSILWMLTNKCVTNCKYCYADRNTKYEPLSTERILELINEFADLKMGYVDIIGGEVFLHKDWDIILKSLVEKNLSPTYISTKIPITLDIANRLNDTGFRNTIQFSLDSINERVLKDIIGVSSGYVDKIKRGITYLEKLNIPIQIDTILTSKNCSIEEIDRLYAYVKSIKNIKIWEIRVPEFSLYSPESFNRIKATRSEIRMVQKYVKDKLKPTSKINILFSSEPLDEKFRSYGPKEDCFKGGSCGILQNRAFVLPDGKVSVCEQMYWHKDFIIGDLKTSSIEDIWNSERALQLFGLANSMFRDESNCKHCFHFDECNSKKRRCVVKVVKAYGLSNWDYPDPRCEYAPEFNNDLIY